MYTVFSDPINHIDYSDDLIDICIPVVLCPISDSDENIYRTTTITMCLLISLVLWSVVYDYHILN